MDRQIKKTGELETEARTIYYEACDDDGDKIKISVTVVFNRPDDHTVENFLIVRGIEDNGVDVYTPQSSINLFLSNILNLPCEGTQCHHSYDCCGCLYADPIIIKKIGDKHWYCVQRWTRNI